MDSGLVGGDVAPDVFVIRPLSALPALSDPTGGTTIDGRTQVTFGGDTNPFGPEIVLNGGAAPVGTNGLILTSNDNAVFGLNIQGFAVFVNSTLSGTAIAIPGGDNNVVAGNYLGTNATGTAAIGNVAGVGVNGIAVNNRIGGTDPADRNVISGNSTGLRVGDGPRGTRVEGNYIGPNAAGTASLGNPSFGVILQGDVQGTVVGGTAAGAGNVITGSGQGVWFGGGAGVNTGNFVQGNFIGTDPAGTAVLGGNGRGILVQNSHGNTIGGSVAGARNVIGGNGEGVVVFQSNDTVMQGNHIGINAAGTAGLSNGTGVVIQFGSLRALVGANGDGVADAAERNVISGNSGHGVVIEGAGTTGNVVAGNYIGTNAAGTAAVANGQNGVVILNGASRTRVGTDGDGVADAAERNVISGNGRENVWIVGGGTNDTVVAGNFIGTDAAGTAALTNGFGAGLGVFGGAGRTRIGTNGDGVSDDLERNVISGNRAEGVLIGGAGTNDTVVAGNFVGTDATGTAAIPNLALAGVYVRSGAANNRIGTNGDGVNDTAERNVISGNSGRGVMIENAGTNGNIVAGNYIGTNAAGTGAVPNAQQGVLVLAGASQTRIGTNADGIGDEAERNVISGNSQHGIELNGFGTTGTVVAGNYIGTRADGKTALPNGTAAGTWAGVRVSNQASSNTVGGSSAAAKNIISGNTNLGMQIAGSGTTANVVAGNWIGLNSDGAPLGNGGVGIRIFNGASANLIGTDGDGTADEAERNVISGNTQHGIRIDGGSTVNNTVAGNYVGTDAAGTTRVANGIHGVLIDGGADNNRIGTNGDGIADDAERNIISGNAAFGVLISGAGTTGNAVAGNYIGTQANGLGSVPNIHGVVVANGANNNRIGTDGSNDAFNANERNVIAGNAFYGVSLDLGATANVIAGNAIGVNAPGNAPSPNGWQGIAIDNSSHSNRIGTNGDGVADATEANVIAGSGLDGVIIARGSSGNVVQGNFIGTDPTGTIALGNGGDGVRVVDASLNVIGGVAPGQGNVVAYNLGNGVTVLGNSSGNTIRGNSVFGNAGLSIDLGGDGVTVNDPLDADSGSNELQNTPVITSSSTGTTTRVVGQLSGAPNATFTIDFYASAALGTGNTSQAGRYLGSTTVTTDGNGLATFDIVLSAATSAGELVTATATDSAGNTSELSVVSTQQQTAAIQEFIIELVQGGDLNSGQGNSLLTKMESVVANINKDKLNTAANQLQAFINHTLSLVAEGVLSSEEAAPILSAAYALLDELLG